MLPKPQREPGKRTRSGYARAHTHTHKRGYNLPLCLLRRGSTDGAHRIWLLEKAMPAPPTGGHRGSLELLQQPRKPLSSVLLQTHQLVVFSPQSTNPFSLRGSYRDKVGNFAPNELRPPSWCRPDHRP
ncbi:hypothetical protein LX36DRAFT_351744 [Colletotrichum falcatum]|nr:hypothetical protein LX36DRAFT_351744 [Colletotrichum falcatum]